MVFFTDFSKVAHSGLNGLLTFQTLPENINAELSLYRTQGEIEDVDNIDNVTAKILEG